MATHPNIPISYAFWCKNRPFWIVHRKVSARDTCGCTPCSNMTLIVQALFRVSVVEKNNTSDIINLFCCENKTEKCLLRECKKCKTKKVTYKNHDSTANAYYFKWVVKKDTFFDRKSQKQKLVKKTTKQKFCVNISDIIKEFENTIIDFLKHRGRALSQHKQIASKKQILKDNEVMLHMDFSENYSLKYAEETQTFHFGGSSQQISLHTVVIYFKTEDKVNSKCFCTLSESLQHNSVAIWAHLRPVLSYISENLNADTLHFVSDSPSTQYRNRTMFYILGRKLHELYPKIKSLSWNYLEAGHGRGAPDGIGGITKRTADRLVADHHCII